MGRRQLIIAYSSLPGSDKKHSQHLLNVQQYPATRSRKRARTVDVSLSDPGQDVPQRLVFGPIPVDLFGTKPSATTVSQTAAGQTLRRNVHLGDQQSSLEGWEGGCRRCKSGPDVWEPWCLGEDVHISG